MSLLLCVVLQIATVSTWRYRALPCSTEGWLVRPVCVRWYSGDVCSCEEREGAMLLLGGSGSCNAVGRWRRRRGKYHKGLQQSIGPRRLRVRRVDRHTGDALVVSADASVAGCLGGEFPPLIIIIRIIIINDNVYGAILMTMLTARVHPVHLMNAD